MPLNCDFLPAPAVRGCELSFANPHTREKAVLMNTYQKIASWVLVIAVASGINAVVIQPWMAGPWQLGVGTAFVALGTFLAWFFFAADYEPTYDNSDYKLVIEGGEVFWAIGIALVLTAGVTIGIASRSHVAAGWTAFVISTIMFSVIGFTLRQHRLPESSDGDDNDLIS